MATTNLFEAIEAGDLAAVEALLTAGADCDELDLFGYHATPLSYAAARGQAAIVAALLRAGANPDWGPTELPLHAATGAGATEVVALLLAAGAAVDALDEEGQTALAVAADLGHGPTARRLVEAGADPLLRDEAGEAAADIAAAAGHAELACYLADPAAFPPDGPFWRQPPPEPPAPASTAPAESSEPPKWTMKKGVVTIEEAGYRVVKDFQSVAGDGLVEVAQAMLDNGLAADWVMARGTWTALMMAARAGELAMVELLLERGADVGYRDAQRQTVLHALLQAPSTRRHTPVMRRLLAAGADPNAADEQGRRPLQMALTWSAVDLVEALVEAGADPWLADRHGRQVADWFDPAGKHADRIRAILDRSGP